MSRGGGEPRTGGETRGGGPGVLTTAAWILLFAGVGIVLYELLTGRGFSLVGTGVAVVAGATLWGRQQANG